MPDLFPPTQNLTSSPKVIKKKSKLKTFLVSFFSVLLIIITLFGVTGFFLIFLPARNLFAQINNLKSEEPKIKTAIASKDLAQISSEITSLRQKINMVDQALSKFKYASALPIARDYFADGQRLIKIANDAADTADIVIKAVEPYQDFLGLKGTSVSSAKTTEDRIAFLTDSIEGLVPHLATIEAKIAQIETTLNQIDSNRYPVEYQGTIIQGNILKAQEMVTEVHKIVKDGQPLLAKTSWLLGKDAPRQYFLLFQNDAELRPSGGFLTAYGILKVDKGKVSPVVSDDIYALDAKLQSTTPAPRPLKAYHINVPYLNIRDTNLSPDFPTDVEAFLTLYRKINPKDKFDAVISIDTQVLVDFVKVLGRVGVPGWGNFTPDPDKRCDGCPQIIYQLEYIAGKPRNYWDNNRKGFLAPLMHSLLVNAFGSPKEKIAPLAQAMLTDVYQKHIMFYFFDPVMQKAAVSANIAGNIVNTDTNVDYLHINNSNMASAKSNIFIRDKIKHEIITTNGKVEHKVTVTYTNPSKASNCNLEKGDLCLNAAKYRDWFRFYVPTGSTLTKMTGSEVDPVLYQESGKQVFEGFYGNKYPLYAQSSLRTSIQYTSSVPASKNYTLYLQKQPGTKPTEYELSVNGQLQESFVWVTDKTIKLAL